MAGRILVFHSARTSSTGVTVRALLSDGDGTVTAGPEVRARVQRHLWSDDWARGLGDVNGDGRTDLVFHSASTSSTGIKVRAFLSNSAAHGRLTSITNGLGATTTIAYTPSTNTPTRNSPLPCRRSPRSPPTTGTATSPRPGMPTAAAIVTSASASSAASTTSRSPARPGPRGAHHHRDLVSSRQ